MATGGPSRILIVDDSAVMRSLLRSVITAAPGLEVAGTAADGASALNAIEALRPGLVLLDVEMPVMDGLVTLKKLRARGHKVPVIMCSALTRRGATVTIEALAVGASDYVAKPAGQASREAAIQALAQDLIPKIHALTCELRIQPPAFPGGLRTTPIFPLAPPPRVQQTSSVPTVVAIGVSTGGPAALDVLLPALPENFPLPVLVVQHMPEMFTRLFADRLNRRCRLPVREAAEGDPVRPGVIYIAKGNWHMEVLAAARIGSPPTLHLNQAAPENHCRPAVDALFRSVAAVYGARVLGVVLTGMGSDGMIGCRIIRDQGGSVVAQDQATSAVWGMPGAVANAGLAHKVLPLQAIAWEITRLVRRPQAQAGALRETVA
ncbi:MAG: chemotaxis response regulator protein-glutamate methylesterase [Terracidiphilus sp.]